MIGLAVLVATLACQTPPQTPAPAPGQRVIVWPSPGETTEPVPPPPPRAPGTGILGFKIPAPTEESRPLSGGDFLRSQAQTAAPTPSVADLFRERNAREAAASAAQAPATVPDGTYHCRRTENALVCGTNEDEMRRVEAANKAMLDRLSAPN